MTVSNNTRTLQRYMDTMSGSKDTTTVTNQCVIVMQDDGKCGLDFDCYINGISFDDVDTAELNNTIATNMFRYTLASLMESIKNEEE